MSRPRQMRIKGSHVIRTIYDDAYGCTCRRRYQGKRTFYTICPYGETEEQIWKPTSAQRARLEELYLDMIRTRQRARRERIRAEKEAREAAGQGHGEA